MSTPAPTITELRDALADQGIKLPDEQVALLDHYRQLLWEWNTRLNLTRHDDLVKFVRRDVVDSLAFSAALAPGEDVLDVGTGGGVPGVILAIVRPDVSVSLCESVGKKATAVADIVAQLGLAVPPHQVTLHHARAEALLEEGEVYDTLIVRAVARLDKLLTWFNPYWGSFHRLLVLKGPTWTAERQACREKRLIQHLELRRLSSYTVSLAAGNETEGHESEGQESKGQVDAVTASSVLLQIQPRREAPMGE